MAKVTLATGEIYHVYSRSIAEFKIFNNEKECIRMQQTIGYYQFSELRTKFSKLILESSPKIEGNNKIVKIIAYCIMPTHLHLAIQQIQENGISIFVNKILNSYTRFFNLRHNRKGPLWETRFKRVLVKTDEQLLHLTRYIHLNPVTAYLVEKPGDWKYSSYNEYLAKISSLNNICDFRDLLNISPESYEGFVNSNISYQRELAKIKSITVNHNPTA